MRLIFTLLGVIVMSACAVSPARAQKDQNLLPFVLGVEAGEGQLRLHSDQVSGDRAPKFAIGFFGGHTLGRRARIALELNRSLLQSYSAFSSTVGESVSNVLAVVDLFPIRKAPVFIRSGAGLALYDNHRVNGLGGTGWAWTAGLGYEIRLHESLGLAPIVDYSAGSFGDVRNSVTVETGRGYSAVEFKVALIGHVGKSR